MVVVICLIAYLVDAAIMGFKDAKTTAVQMVTAGSNCRLGPGAMLLKSAPGIQF